MNGILQGVPRKGSYSDLMTYLTSTGVLKRAASLDSADFDKLEIALTAWYLPTDLKMFKGAVNGMKYQKTKPKQSSTQQSSASPPGTIKSAGSHSRVVDEYLRAGPSPGYSKTTIYSRSDFYRYESGVWKRYDEELISREVDNLLRAREAQLGKTYTFTMVRGIVGMLKYELFVEPNRLDAFSNLINLRNGVYNTDTKKLQSHEPRFYLTTQLPFNYNNQAKCPLWNKYLDSTLVFKDGQGGWLRDQDLIDFVQEAIGYSLTTSVEHQVMFFMVGQGANGKGVLMNALIGLAGNAAIPIDLSSLKSTNTYQLALAAGKRVIHCAEAEAHSRMMADGIIKALVAGDPLMVRQIKEKPFELKSVAKIWWSMNRLPDVADTSHGFWRRVRVVPFNRIFRAGAIDKKLSKKLLKEFPGIFNWAMTGLKRVQVARQFTSSAQVEDWTRNYQAENNPIESFIFDRCNTGSYHTTPISPLYQAYREWALINGFRPMNSKKLKMELINLGYYPQYDNRRGSPWMGLEVAPVTTSPYIP